MRANNSFLRRTENIVAEPEEREPSSPVQAHLAAAGLEEIIAEHGFIEVLRFIRRSLKSEADVRAKCNDPEAYRYQNAAIDVRTAIIELEKYEQS